MNVVNVGLAVGQGTGPELADIFSKVLDRLGSHFQVQIELHRSDRIYHSYCSLSLAGIRCRDDVHKETMRDATHYEQFCRNQAEQGTRVIFRTAITAQSLYLVRQNLQAVKVERFVQGASEILLVRDQAQGFYTGSNQYAADMETVSRTCQFSKNLTARILSYSIERAREVKGQFAVIDNVIMVYKHHLFDGIFDTWAEEWSKKYDVKISLVQPDTMNRNLLAFGTSGFRLIIASNEYADIMQVLFLDMFGQGVQEDSYAENVYLHPQMNGLAEFQTVHGSADDLVGTGTVDPSATIKAAAGIFERYGGFRGIEEALGRTIQRLLRQNIVTPDKGGSSSTTAYVDAVLSSLFPSLSMVHGASYLSSSANHASTVSPIPNRDRMDMSLPMALVIVDFQIDFAAAAGGSQPSSFIEDLASNIHTLASLFRAHHHEVIFVRFLGNVAYLPSNWQYRNRALGQPPEHCVDGTQGATFIPPLNPLPNERVFDKKAAFDAFLCEGFERHLRDRGYEHLVLVGLYGDVCVDATARTAFQKGFYTTVVEDCVATIYTERGSCLAFMERVYGARLVTCGDIVRMFGEGEA